VVKQAIRDMHEEIGKMEEALAALDRTIEDQQRATQRLEESLTELRRQLELCLEKDDEQLVRIVMRRKLESEKRTHALSLRIAAIRAERERRAAALGRYREELRRIEERFEVLSFAVNTGVPERDGVSDADVEVALLEERARRQAIRSV
jgi:phage shock protein A